MPVLKDMRLLRTIELPGYPESKVTIYDSLLVSQFSELTGGSDAKSFLNTLALLIKEWNFTDEAGKDLAINADNVGLLTGPALTALGDAITELRDDAKKASSNSQS